MLEYGAGCVDFAKDGLLHLNIQFVSPMPYNIQRCVKWSWTESLEIGITFLLPIIPKDRTTKWHDMTDGNLQEVCFDAVW